MRPTTLLMPLLFPLMLVMSSAPGLLRAQEPATTVPDLSNVTLVETDCDWLNTGDEDVVASLGPITCGTVLGCVSALPEGQSNELLIRLFLLDKLPNTRATLVQFVERAFAEPGFETDRYLNGPL